MLAVKSGRRDHVVHSGPVITRSATDEVPGAPIQCDRMFAGSETQLRRGTRDPRRRRLAAFVVAAAVLAVLPAAVGSSAPTGSDATLVRLSWTDDPAATITIRWVSPGSPPIVRVRTGPDDPWLDATGTTIRTTPEPEHEVTVRRLAPDTRYEYQLASGTTTWDSTLRSFRTAPADGAFEAVFVADTGIAGRTDGLANGTRQVIDEIAALDPLLVLGGGDYAYYSSEERYADLNAAIDGWIAQMQPVISTRAFLPTYGNHEVLLGENVDQWIARFATPAGSPGRRSYSFDVAGVHFIALLGYESQIDAASEAWLRADLESARAAGVDTIVPYLHRNTHGDGTVHPPSPSLARQLTRILEPYDVSVVLTAHDQSYERTYPLLDGEPTTARRDCQTPADGITWIKSSPGGKMSNQVWDFSTYSATPPDPTIAVRDDSLHHFSRLRFGPGSNIDVITYGVVGDGTTPVEIDRVRYRRHCPTDEFGFATLPVSLDVDAGAASRSIELELTGANQTIAVATTTDWLRATTDTAGQLSVTADLSGLAPGVHAAEVRASMPGRDDAVLPIVVKVRGDEGAPVLVASLRPGRSGPMLLDGARVNGTIYVTLLEDGRVDVADAGMVRFLANGRKIRADRDPPFDLVGGSQIAAGAWDTTRAVDGEHTVEAVIVGPDGRTTRAFARFTVDNATTAGEPAAISGETYQRPDDAVAGATVQPVVPTLPAGLAATEPDSGWWTSWYVLLGGTTSVGLIVALIAAAKRGRPPG